MKRSSLVLMTLSMPVLAALIQGSGCGPVPTSKMDLTVNKSGQGTVTCNPGDYSYDSGTVVTMTATASAGWVFDHWEGALSGSTNPTTLTMDADKTATAVFAEGSAGCTELAQTEITTNTTIPAGCWLVNDDIHVSGGATLTLAPGATLQFAQDTGITVESDGVLIAVGTVASPIVLTGQAQTRGSWDGVDFENSTSSNNVLSYVTIEYGGGGEDYYSADLTLWGTSKVAVTHCTLRQCPNYGFWFHDASTVTAFENNTVTANANGAGSVHASDVGVLTGTSSYTGNDVNLVAVRGGSTAVDQVWSAIGVEYLIESQVNVDHHATLAPGTELVFANGVGLSVTSTGSLTAQGTAASPILMTTTQATRGYWDGVEFDDSNSVNNVLSYVTIEYGGGEGNYYSSELTVWGTSQVAVDHCTLRQSANYGFWFHESSNVTSFENCVVTQNVTGAGSVHPKGVGILSTTSTYTGNDTDLVAVRGGGTGVNQTWHAIGVDYLLEASLSVDHHTTLEPGVTLVFENDLNLTVRSSGILTAQGTVSAPILLTATDATQGRWQGVEFDDSNSSSNLLSYVTIEYGGGGGEYYSANLTVWGTSRVDVQHCIIQESETYGIWVFHTATCTRSNNTFANNSSGNVFIQP